MGHVSPFLGWRPGMEILLPRILLGTAIWPRVHRVAAHASATTGCSTNCRDVPRLLVFLSQPRSRTESDRPQLLLPVTWHHTRDHERFAVRPYYMNRARQITASSDTPELGLWPAFRRFTFSSRAGVAGRFPIRLPFICTKMNRIITLLFLFLLSAPYAPADEPAKPKAKVASATVLPDKGIFTFPIENIGRMERRSQNAIQVVRSDRWRLAACAFGGPSGEDGLPARTSEESQWRVVVSLSRDQPIRRRNGTASWLESRKPLATYRNQRGIGTGEPATT